MNPEHYVNTWQSVFRQYVGDGQFITYIELSNASGVALHTLRDLSAGHHLPRWSAAWSILGSLPFAATAEIMRSIGFEISPIDRRGSDRDACAAMSSAAAALSEALRDNRVDYKERAEIKPHVQEAVAEGQKWLNGVGDTVKLQLVGKIS